MATHNRDILTVPYEELPMKTNTSGGTTIIMVTHNRDILTVPYEELQDDKDIIGKAMEELQNKCLMSYTKTCENKVIQKYPLPRILINSASTHNISV
jgi:hypothetical protein